MTSGLYVHVPFCTTRCPFCAFAITTQLDRRNDWRATLSREIELWSRSWTEPVSTIYIGGGTPSQIPADGLAGLFDELRAAFDVSEDVEICIECHPGHLNVAALRTLRSAGLTRLSIGVQSFDDDELAALGREHTGAQAIRAIEDARTANIPSVSIDLLYALPQRSRAAWERQIEEAERRAPDHVAAYVLTFEPGTSYTARRDRGDLTQPSSETEADLFRWTHRRLNDAGFEAYEASNFARSAEHRSRHNQGYWKRRAYLGLGPSAHAFRDERRWSNPPSIDKWMRAVEQRELPVSEPLTAADIQLERLFLGLRTQDGVELSEPEFASLSRALAGLVHDGRAEIHERRLRLTLDGLAVAESIALGLADELTSRV